MPLETIGPSSRSATAFLQPFNESNRTRQMTVGNILKANPRDLVTLKPDQLITEALVTMEFEDVGAVAVCRQKARISGILSERDIVRGLRFYGEEIFDLKVADLMSTEIVKCDLATPVAAAIARLKAHGARHIAVVDNGKLEALLCLQDLVPYLRIGQTASHRLMSWVDCNRQYTFQRHS